MDGAFVDLQSMMIATSGRVDLLLGVTMITQGVVGSRDWAALRGEGVAAEVAIGIGHSLPIGH